MDEQTNPTYRHIRNQMTSMTTSLGVLQLGRHGVIENLDDLIEVKGRDAVIGYLDANPNFFPEEAVPVDTEREYVAVEIDLSGYQDIVFNVIKRRMFDSKGGIGLTLLNSVFEARSLPTIGSSKRNQILESPYKSDYSLREIFEQEKAQIKKEQGKKAEKTDIFNMPEPVIYRANPLDKANMAQEHLGGSVSNLETGLSDYADIPTE